MCPLIPQVILTILFVCGTAQAEFLSYDVTGTTETGSTCSMTFVYSTEDEPKFANPDQSALWYPVGCNFTINDTSYDGDVEMSNYYQSNEPHFSSHHNALNCGDGTTSVFFRVEYPGGFNNVTVAEPLKLPAIVFDAHCNSDPVVTATVTKNKNTGVVEYDASGVTNAGTPITMSFAYYLHGVPHSGAAGEYARWIPARCAFSINGTSYPGFRDMSSFEQNVGGTISQGRPMDSIHCVDASNNDIFLLLEHAGGHDELTQAEKLILPAVLVHGQIPNHETITQITVTERKNQPVIMTPQYMLLL